MLFPLSGNPGIGQKFIEELLPYCWDVINKWVEGVKDFSHVSGPSSYFWPFYQGKSEGHSLYW